MGDQDGFKISTSVNFPITLIVSLLFVAVLLLSCLFLWCDLRSLLSCLSQTRPQGKKNEELKVQIDVLTDELKRLKTQLTAQTNVGRPPLISVQAEGSQKCLEFLSVKYLSVSVKLQAFKVHAEQELKWFAARITELRVRVEEVGKAIESMESYSCQCNVKIVGVQELRSQESAMDKSNLCVKLFSEMGANITLQDVGIAHRVPQRNARAT